MSLSSKGSKGITSILTFLDTVDQSNLGVAERLQSSHILPMLFTLILWTKERRGGEGRGGEGAP